MANKIRLSLDAAEALAYDALRASGAATWAARSTARALVRAEADGQSGHGLGRIPAYTAQIRAGKVRGDAMPQLEKLSHAAARVDAGLGFAYPAIDMAVDAVATMAQEQFIAVVAIRRSHHFGQAGAHAERLAERGLIALILGNTPKAMAFWGGRAPMLGTNPLAFAAPLPESAGAPLVIDLALSVVARSKIVAAQKTGEPIPTDWACNALGQPTNDPQAALQGSLLPVGGAKGGALALMVEVLAAALTGSSFGWEASSFLDAAGAPPDMGHLLLALDPARLSGGMFSQRMRVLCEAIAADPAVRLPGARRLQHRLRAQQEGISIEAALAADIRGLHG
jgi:(2R)-3-sulfolactate dehydrogenase (NADP+)